MAKLILAILELNLEIELDLKPNLKTEYTSLSCRLLSYEGCISLWSKWAGQIIK